MKNYLLLFIISISNILSYPISSLRDHIKSGNLDYVNRYFQDLSDRELNQADFQFLNGYILTDGKSAQKQFSKLDISDLSGHLAPVFLYKKGNEQYLNKEFNLAIKSFNELIKKYNKSDYIVPTISILVNIYLQMGFPDSAQLIHDWGSNNIKLNLINNSINLNTTIKVSEMESKRNYTIQLGVFGKEKNANQTIKKMKNNGLEPRVDRIVLNGKPLFAVRYGYYETEKEARKIQKKLKNNNKVNSFLKKLN
ncbi:MAG: hypothetical protein CMF96_06440 [Candidatus Marinimicrobia bacterium]|mgnify:CR=1 FL=1|nr:hypothetical protein [Candidatus Neomarinimicrobiota bacterium]|tara:strand:- start:2708 stop:3463 length:756 start_codon:yes stop_codon:yes gene_type:complete